MICDKFVIKNSSRALGKSQMLVNESVEGELSDDDGGAGGYADDN